MKSKKPRAMSGKFYRVVAAKDGVWFDMISYKKNGDRILSGFIIKKDRISRLMRLLIDYTKWVEYEE